jgi:murein hydrolase activator
VVAIAVTLAGMALLVPGGADAGILATPLSDAVRADMPANDAAARRAARAVLAERHARLLREQAALFAAERSAELRLRRLLADFAVLADARAAADAVALVRQDEVESRQRRLEALLAEIVQLSRDTSGDPRRLAQLRAVAAALAEPFAEARRALAESHAAVLALQRREAELLQLSSDARQALVEASTRQSWLGAAIEDTLVAATEAAERASAAERMAARTVARVQRAEQGRRLSAMSLPTAALPTLQSGERAAGGPVVHRLATRALTLRATLVDGPLRRVAHFDLPPTIAMARGRAGGQLMPVAGAVVARFGEGQKAPLDRGLTIEVEERRLVRAPQDGRVVFARAYDGFGLLLIIDHGNEYHSLLSGLSRFVVHEGWAVRAGQMVGTLEPGSEAVGRLYVELRRRGVPVDPLAWIAAGQDKVRS